ncbi:MAG: cobalamin-independent methionine synthase II family protein [Dermatophilaceae bacterium]
MERSSATRILTTHCGSLARPRALLEIMREKEHGRPYDTATFERAVDAAVRDIVIQQSQVGLDVVTDGEMGRSSAITSLVDRLDGFSADEGEPPRPPSWRRETEAFPDFYQRPVGTDEESVVPMRAMACTGPVTYRGHDQVAADITRMTSALPGLDSIEAFLPSTSPCGFGANRYYATGRDYHEAVAEALREEYLAIVDSGLLLQVDDPWLIEILTGAPDSDPDERDREAEEHIEIVNHSLRGIPTERVRLHACFGLDAGPRVHDLDLAVVAPYLLRVNAGAYSFEAASPRHAHEWRIWEEIELPDDKVLVPGLVGHASPYVEHPRLVADQLGRYVSILGVERVIAGTDCGFSSRASFTPDIPDSIVWEKFRALVEGARIASGEVRE